MLQEPTTTMCGMSFMVRALCPRHRGLPTELLAFPYSREVRRSADGQFSAFHDGFGQRRMWMDALGDIAGNRGHFHGEHAFRYHFARGHADDADAEDPLRAWFNDQLR